mgnify:CR=1 FL=1
MIGFGKDNTEFGCVPPTVISCEEMHDDEGFAINSLLVKIVTYTGLKLQIQFSDYIMHLTRNESFTGYDPEEKWVGKYLILFSKSQLIDFYDRAIMHTEDYSWPGRGTHYGIYTVDHIIDIISSFYFKLISFF